jgi:hypothetical protein
MGRRGWYVAAVIALLLGAGLFALWVLRDVANFTLHGYIAMAIGLIGTTLLAAGLMWLAFHSSRAGWDDLDREDG